MAKEMKTLPRWIKIRRRFAFLPIKTEDTKRFIWLRFVWEVEDSGWEEFLGLIPLSDYFEHENNARESVSVTSHPGGSR
jgi:hypothetical protein